LREREGHALEVDYNTQNKQTQPINDNQWRAGAPRERKQTKKTVLIFFYTYTYIYIYLYTHTLFMHLLTSVVVTKLSAQNKCS